MFKEILAVVMGIFGVDSLPKGEDGKSLISLEQKDLLSKKFGKEFVSKFETELAEFEKTNNVPSATELKETQEKNAKLTTELKNALAQIDVQKKMVEALSKKPEDDVPTEKVGNTKIVSFKPDMSLMHNKVIDNYINGDQTLINAADTIVTTELDSEFGKYITNYRYDIVKSLTQPVESTSFMKTVMAGTEWRANHAIITSIVQQFVSKWTPTGQTTFTTLTITNRKHKVNLPITPADVMESYLGYLYDESMTPEQMPIVKFIINELMLPKVDEDREMELLATGEYEDISGTPADGDVGQATGKSMDGYVTVLIKMKAASTAIGKWLLPDVADLMILTDAQVVAQINEACDSVTRLYKRKKLMIHIDPDLYIKYKRGYQSLYPNTKNEDASKDRVDFTNFTFAPIAGMVGTGVFFITPKENFIHLMNKNAGASKVYLQTQNYDVKVFAEWWEAVGFAIAEAIFAYVPDQGSGSGSGAGA